MADNANRTSSFMLFLGLAYGGIWGLFGLGTWLGIPFSMEPSTRGGACRNSPAFAKATADKQADTLFPPPSPMLGAGQRETQNLKRKNRFQAPFEGASTLSNFQRWVQFASVPEEMPSGTIRKYVEDRSRGFNADIGRKTFL